MNHCGRKLPTDNRTEIIRSSTASLLTNVNTVSRTSADDEICDNISPHSRLRLNPFKAITRADLDKRLVVDVSTAVGLCAMTHVCWKVPAGILLSAWRRFRRVLKRLCASDKTRSSRARCFCRWVISDTCHIDALCRRSPLGLLFWR